MRRSAREAHTTPHDPAAGEGDLKLAASGTSLRAETKPARLNTILSRRPALAGAIAVACGSYFVYYIVWRLATTLNPDALGFSLVVFAAEAYGLLTFLLFAFMVWDVTHIRPFASRAGLNVDIYVPTYNEDRSLLEATLIGCNAVTYPHTTYLLDDGRRPEMAALAERLGCRYLTRPDNKHAKAGNLNAALPRTDGDFIAILDADTIPQPDFLDKTLGYFVDDRVALVQLPQEFFNLDSAQHLIDEHGVGSWHEQQLFYRAIQPGKNRSNAAFWCGSPSVLRRGALIAVGGVATETVTEDIHTSIRLHGQGWRIVYHDEVLAYGQAPQTLNAFAVQRLRWAQGSMQLLRSRENPLIAPGLSLAQRLNYLASMLTYFDSYQKLILLLTPSVILLSGLLPISVGGLEFFTHWLPYYLLVWGTNTLLGRGYYRHVTVEQFNLLKMFLFLRASVTLIWPRALDFKVTPKSVGATTYSAERAELLPHMVALATVVFSIVLGIANVLWGLSTQYTSSLDVIFVTFLWSLFNAAMLGFPIVGVLRRAHNRRTYRFPVRLAAEVLTTESGARSAAVATDLSGEGARLVSGAELALGSLVSLTLQIPDGAVTVEGEIAHRGVRADGVVQWGVRFTNVGVAERQRLTAFLFITASREQRTTESAGLTKYGLGLPELPEAASVARASR